MTRERALDASWKGWLRENLDRGCSRPELVQILKNHGFSLSSIRANMGAEFPEDTPEATRRASEGGDRPAGPVHAG
jgi:prolyl 4-hydroxylase